MTEQDSTSSASPLARLTQVIARSPRFRGDPEALDSGEQAALARLDPEAPRPHHVRALVRALLLAGLSPDDWQVEAWKRWALIAHGMALSGHDGTSRFGKQLAGYGDPKRAVSESRVTRLLTARGDAFSQQVPRVLRLLASRGIAPNWFDLGALILATDHDEIRAETLRLRIASAYYASVHR